MRVVLHDGGSSGWRLTKRVSSPSVATLYVSTCVGEWRDPMQNCDRGDFVRVDGEFSGARVAD